MTHSPPPTSADDVTVRQEDRASALIERIGTFADLLASEPLEGPKGDIAYDLLREAAAQISSDRLRLRIAHQATGEVERLREALDGLQNAEASYRKAHDLHGDADRYTGRMWDLMRRAGDKARAALAIKGE